MLQFLQQGMRPQSQQTSSRLMGAELLIWFLNIVTYEKIATLSVADLFEVNETDTVWDAWLVAVNLLDMLEHTHGLEVNYDFDQVRERIAKICTIAETHSMDKTGSPCMCGLSDAEHSILKRKILKFFRLQVSNLKHFIV